MNEELINYLITYYSHLLPSLEKMALKHMLWSEKVAAIDNENSRARMRAMMLRKGWLSTDDEVADLLQSGIPAFRRRLAHKIYTEHGGDSLLNNCPRCGHLTRTPTAKQCRHCGADWHRD